ncbi:MAG: O-antigen ligase family protein [Actinomycetota bacterium]
MRRDSLALFLLAAVIAAALYLQGSYYPAQLRIVAIAAVLSALLVKASLPKRALAAFGLLALGLLVSWSFTGFVHEAEKPALTLVLCASIAALASTASTRSKDGVLDAIVLVTSVFAGAGILAVAFHVTPYAFLAQSWRSNVLTYQNADAALFAIGLPAALVRGGKRTGPRVAAVVIATGLAATQSRGGAIAAAAGILVLLLRERPAALPRLFACSALAFLGLLPSISGAWWGWMTALPALAIGMLVAGQARRITPRTTFRVRLALAVIAVGAVTAITIAFTPATHRFATTSNGRLTLWKNALHVIAKHPVVGTGPGTYALHSQLQSTKTYSIHAHNEYLETAQETGLVGLVFVFAAIAVIAIAVPRNRDPASDAALAAGVAFLIHSSFDFLWRIPALPALVFALAAASLTKSRDSARVEA